MKHNKNHEQNNTSPLVSIIVPIYNTEKYLKKCVNSILAQSYKNIELFLINDGSTDNSGIICDEFAKRDLRIKVIHKSNEGQAIARNYALDVCNGQYILFVDSDDYIKQNTLELLVNAAISNNADMVLFGVEYDYIKFKKQRLVFNNNQIFTKEQILTEYIVKKTIPAIMCDKFYKRKFFEKLRFPNLRANEDAYVLPEIFGNSEKTIYLREALYCQLVRVGSTEQSGFKESKLAALDVANHKKEYINTNFPELSRFVEAEYANALMRMLSIILSSFAYKKNKKLYNNLLNELKKEIAKLPGTVDNKLLICIKHQAFFKFSNRLHGIKRFFIQGLKKLMQK